MPSQRSEMPALLAEIASDKVIIARLYYGHCILHIVFLLLFASATHAKKKWSGSRVTE